MEDPRITKTKQKLKNTMLDMISEGNSIEQITVKQICDRARTSRVTYYTHFTDKFNLLNACINDMADEAQRLFYRHQLSRSISNEPGTEENFMCVLESIMDLMEMHTDFFSALSKWEKNSYLFFSIYWKIMRAVEQLALPEDDSGEEDEEDEAVREAVKALRLNANFVCYGLWGFLHEGRAEGLSPEELRTAGTKLLTDILATGILARPERDAEAEEKPD